MLVRRPASYRETIKRSPKRWLGFHLNLVFPVPGRSVLTDVDPPGSYRRLGIVVPWLDIPLWICLSNFVKLGNFLTIVGILVSYLFRGLHFACRGNSCFLPFPWSSFCMSWEFLFPSFSTDVLNATRHIRPFLCLRLSKHFPILYSMLWHVEVQLIGAVFL